MPMHYHTDYSLGRWGGRVSRTHSGIRALVAIGIDLVFSLIFGAVGLVFFAAALILVPAVRVVGFAIRVLVEVAVATVRFLGEILAAPIRVLRRRPAVGDARVAALPVAEIAPARLERPAPAPVRRATAKPAYAGFSEI